MQINRCCLFAHNTVNSLSAEDVWIQAEIVQILQFILVVARDGDFSLRNPVVIEIH